MSNEAASGAIGPGGMGGGGGVGSGIKTVDGNTPDANGNVLSAGPKTAAAVSTLIANGTKTDRAPAVAAYQGDGINATTLLGSNS